MECPALPCPALPCPALPCPALPWPWPWPWPPAPCPLPDKPCLQQVQQKPPNPIQPFESNTTPTLNTKALNEICVLAGLLLRCFRYISLGCLCFGFLVCFFVGFMVQGLWSIAELWSAAPGCGTSHMQGGIRGMSYMVKPLHFG